jgi:putative effector of murein hydrolase
MYTLLFVLLCWVPFIASIILIVKVKTSKEIVYPRFGRFLSILLWIISVVCLAIAVYETYRFMKAI